MEKSVTSINLIKLKDSRILFIEFGKWYIKFGIYERDYKTITQTFNGTQQNLSRR